jgi:PAB-dependent poly(A)-specific ribonuclease subunit 2
VLARVSVVRGDRSERMGDVLIDDYIRTSEPVVDYLTKYSGIQPGQHKSS